MSAGSKKMALDIVEAMPPPDRLRRWAPGDEPDQDDEDGGASMGDALASAIKSGDGRAIYEAFKDLADHCSG